MRPSVIGSGIVHGVLLALLLVVRTSNTIIVPGPDIVQVSLIEPESSRPIAAAPVEPPKPEPAAVQPTEETGVKLAPPPPKKRKPEPEPKRAAPQPSVALPYAAVGSAGLRGQVTVDTNFEFAYYLSLVRNRVAQSWAPPAGLTSGGQPIRAVIHFRIGRGGEVLGVELETGSGYEYFDRSAVRAVQLSDPLPPLPLGYSGADLGVHFGFEFVTP